MFYKKLTRSCKITCMTFLLTACSSGVSNEAKRLYNEQIDIYQQHAYFLEKSFEKEEPSPSMQLMHPTAFFHMTIEEEKVWESADFDKEKRENLEKGKQIEQDSKMLYDAFPKSLMNPTQEEIDYINETFHALKVKYKNFNYTLERYE